MENQLSFTRVLKVCLICVLGTMSSPFDGLYANSSSGGARVVSVNGVVRVEGRNLKSGDVIAPGSVIKTGQGAGIKILLSDQSILDLGADTQFRIESMVKSSDGERKVNLSLENGSLRALVTKKLNSKSSFTIRTKSSVLAVRGTEFSVNLDQKGERITVSDGNVLRTSVTDRGKSLELAAGTQFVGTFKSEGSRGVASEGTAVETKVASLTPEEARKEVGNNVVEDKTFIKNVDISKGGEGVENNVGGNSTLTSVAIASGAEERPKPRAERGEKGERGLDGGKQEKGERGAEKGSNARNLPPPGSVGGPPSGPAGTGGGAAPTVPPITPNDSNIAAKIIMSVN